MPGTAIVHVPGTAVATGVHQRAERSPVPCRGRKYASTSCARRSVKTPGARQGVQQCDSEEKEKRKRKRKKGRRVGDRRETK
eukprot:1745360-Rhodomonas_salina.2